MRQHQQSRHEGIKYDCKQCDYKSTQQHVLRKHQNTAMKE